MAFEHVAQCILTDAPGTISEVSLFHIGPSDAKIKIYLQAGLHADEQPGIMVLHHLLPLLRSADENGDLDARFTVIPMVNPLGMNQRVFENHIGRYDFRSGLNFNRRWPDLFAAVGTKVAQNLTDNPDANVAMIRQCVREWLDEQEPATALHRLRHLVMTHAYDADYVLDLHCDNEALVHLFVTPDSMENLTELADHLGSVAQLTAPDSGGGSFDEVWPYLWTQLRETHPDKPIPFSAAAATLEFRGQHDVFDDLGKEDAGRLFAFFQAKGFVKGTPPKVDPAPKPLPLSATEMLRVDKPGLLAYRVKLGDYVEKGQPVADLIALDGPNAFLERTPVCAGTAGRVISRNMAKFVVPGNSIAKIVGTEPLAGREGYLLED